MTNLRHPVSRPRLKVTVNERSRREQQSLSSYTDGQTLWKVGIDQETVGWRILKLDTTNGPSTGEGGGHER